MRQNTGFTLQWIGQVPYLLPFGQNIADHKRGIRLNETGAFLWDVLPHAPSRRALLGALCKAYDIPAERQAEIAQDLDDFLAKLTAMGMIVSDEESSPCNPDGKELEIGGHVLRLCGPAEAFSPDFDAFWLRQPDPKPADCTVYVHTTPPAARENGTLLLRNRELVVCDRTDDFLLLFPASAGILEASLKKDSSIAHFYVRPPLDAALQTDLFHAIRLVFLYLAQSRGQFVLHSASILYKGKAWLFSGHAGMGKSTHTNLWKNRYQTPILNGDLNLLELTPQGPMVHGLPWCGTSGISTTETYPLGGIVLLGRADTDRVETLTEDEKALLVMQRLISPSWTVEQLTANLGFAASLTAQVPVCRLKCTKSVSAVDTIRKWIDAR